MDRVLHVTEAMGGGITTAIESYVHSTRAEFRHSLLYVARTRHDTGSDLIHMFDSVHRASGLLDLSCKLRRLIGEQRPDVVHLHSSIAGFVGRIVVRRKNVPIAYTPHCFDFERTDSPALRNHLTGFVERKLAANTSVVIGVSPHEAELARGLGISARYVPNVVADLSRMNSDCHGASRGQIVTIGRISNQKDPAFFASVVNCAALSRHISPESVTWIGDGPAKLRRVLTDAGITVTGWLPRDEVLRRLSQADVYLHTAAWEGSPMSILEATAMNRPVVARSIPSLTSLGFPDNLTTPRAVAERLIAVMHDPLSRTDLRLLDRHTMARQGVALAAAYRVAIERQSSDPGIIGDEGE